jgi:hypothetical protein
VTKPVDPIYLQPCYSLRSRREVSTLDRMNARLYEHWQTDNRQGPAATPTNPYMDMKPNMARTDYRDMRGQLTYKPGVDGTLSGQYFSKYDPVSDPINVVRELTSAVNEPIEDRGMAQATKIADRQFGNRWTRGGGQLVK